MGLHCEDAASWRRRGPPLSTEASYGVKPGLNVRLVLEEEAKFAGGAFGAEVVGEVEGGSGAGGYGGNGEKSTEGEETGGFVEAEAGTELTGGGAEDAA